MTNPEPKTYFSTILHLFTALGDSCKQIIHLIILEFKIAEKSLCALIYASLIMIIFVMGSWILIMTLMVLGITFLLHNLFVAVLIIALLNIALTCIMAFKIMQLTRNLTFPYTRKHLAHWREINDGNAKTVKTSS